MGPPQLNAEAVVEAELETEGVRGVGGVEGVELTEEDFLLFFHSNRII